jgi:hypothetical protein
MPHDIKNLIAGFFFSAISASLRWIFPERLPKILKNVI